MHTVEVCVTLPHSVIASRSLGVQLLRLCSSRQFKQYRIYLFIRVDSVLTCPLSTVCSALAYFHEHCTVPSPQFIHLLTLICKTETKAPKCILQSVKPENTTLVS